MARCPAARRDLDGGPGGPDRRPHRHVRPRRARRPSISELIRGNQPRPDRGREVLALGRSHPDRHLVALKIARRPVVQDEVAADRLLRPVLGQVEGRRVDEGADLELEVELGRAARCPDRIARTAKLGDVREVEDRQPVPGLGNLAAPPLPHRVDVLLERIEVAERRRPKDGWPELQIRGIQDRIVVRIDLAAAGAAGALEQVGERLHPKTAGEVLVEGQDREPEEDAVVGPPLVGGGQPASGDLEVQPGARLRLGLGAVTKCRRQPPGRAGRRVSLADVGDSHVGSLGPVGARVPFRARVTVGRARVE